MNDTKFYPGQLFLQELYRDGNYGWLTAGPAIPVSSEVEAFRLLSETWEDPENGFTSFDSNGNQVDHHVAYLFSEDQSEQILVASRDEEGHPRVVAFWDFWSQVWHG